MTAIANSILAARSNAAQQAPTPGGVGRPRSLNREARIRLAGERSGAAVVERGSHASLLARDGTYAAVGARSCVSWQGRSDPLRGSIPAR